MIKIGSTEETILREISSEITETLDRAGIFNRVFSRIKSRVSIEKKLAEKREEYILKNKKLQDVFGIRITLYFLDDQSIAIKLVKNIFEEVPEAHSIDSFDNDRFGPVRNNFVFRIDPSLVETSSLFDQELIDTTFEVQFRTVFSEGWHEVEHDLRYKCKKDWENEIELSRQLNGQLAALETSDWAMLKIFDELAYKKYKAREWGSFFRNVLRIRFVDLAFSSSIMQILDEDPQIVKSLLRIDRIKLIEPIIALTTKVPLKMDTVFFILNRTYLRSNKIQKLESESLSKILTESFPQQELL